LPAGQKTTLFDVLIEGRPALDAVDPFGPRSPASPAGRPIEVDVADGALEIDFVAIQGHPCIASIEIEAR